MATTSFDFSNPSNYTLSNITISSLVAALTRLSDPGKTFSQPFTSGTGFTYNSTNTQISGGSLTQLSTAPATLALYAAWNSSINGNYGTSGLTVTSFNGAAISGSKLALTGSTSKYVTLPAAYSIGNIATCAFIYTPNYSGVPGANQIMLSTSSNGNNYFILYHEQSSRKIKLAVNSSTGTSIVNADLGAWLQTSGTAYTFVLQVDITNGASKVFINGVQQGSTATGTGTRTTANIFYVGRDNAGSWNAEFSISALAIYTSIIAPGSATPLSDTQYTADLITFPTFTYPGTGSIQAFTGFSDTDTNSPGYILNGLYWNGSAWVSSNSSYAQSNPLATVSANIATLPVSNTLVVKVVTTSNNTPMSISSALTVTYTGQHYTTGTILSNSGFTAQELTAFVSTFSATGSDAVQFAFKVNSTLRCWNGSTWAASDGTFAQTNPIATTQANLAALLSVNSTVYVYAILKSNDGTTTPTITDLTVTYDFGAIEGPAPDTCIVFGFLYDIEGLPVQDAIVKFEIFSSEVGGFLNTVDHLIEPSKVTVTTDANGYFEHPILQSPQVLETTLVTQVTITKAGHKKMGPLAITVPDAFSYDLTGLISL